MRRSLLFFLCIGASAFLSACVTTSRPSILTIELFDSRAVGGAAFESSAPLFMAAPSLPGMTVPGSTKAAEVSIPASGPVLGAEQTQTGSGFSVPLAPETISLPAFDAGYVTPARPRLRTAFSLAVPEAPAAAAVSRASPATVSKQTSAQPAKTAAGSAAGASASGNSVITTPASRTPAATAAANTSATGSSAAAGTGASGSTSQTGSAASTDIASSGSYGTLREIYARQGDELQIGLDGTGFLFLGFPDTGAQSEGMSFKSKENRNSKTWFTFQALKLGTYDLDFVKQDNTTGKSTKETVRVHVVEDKDFNAAVAQQPQQDATVTGAVETGDPQFAGRLSSLGSYEAAVAELLKGYKDGNPGLNDQIAGLYMRMGSYDAAGKYYAKNLSSQGPYTQSAVLGLVRIAIAQKDQQGFMSYLKQFLAIQDPAMEEPLMQAARMERDLSQIGVGLDLAAEYAKRFPEGAWSDEAYCLMAQLLEADSQFRDIARAKELYGLIVKEYPESVFAEPARQRLLYIDRHFFQVR